MDAALRSAYYLVTGENPDPDAFAEVRQGQPWREAKFDIPGAGTVRVAVVSGLANTRRLMEAIEREAATSGARMIVLETQSCNEAAIAFYRKNGFSVIGFDLYAYSNTDPERHEVRIEMGKKLHGPSVR